MTERVAIVGGTSGIGLATAQWLVDSGREVVVTGRTLDARDAGALREFFGDLGEVDHVVVTVTGAPGTRPFAEMTEDYLREGVDGKLLPHTLTAQAALKALHRGGSLTFVTAASAGAALPTTAALAAVNAGIEAMVPVLAAELAPVRVNAVSPGVIDTGWWDFLGENREEVLSGMAAGTPVGRVGRPEDIAAAIGFLVDNTFTTGIVVRVDGGARLVSGT
ncbi:NAD(P)-dependent dehydrogenase, short-chain alcohol dehydrogenase family [Amycolatopsis sacchari]|uniref:NAD(P)-dependent dehydrogenase, short-chain alcohol dehydrogenase family n=1 Tax=Amycolatopsis sacchari TaxID=115433 RepID=A0A1I3Y0I8_9PSEU|nr:SDR family oxidoreductase [Amycolatopsis sacchari]SFK24969.1 NAD(P)-dependent dehydrogenase, short-chain alcohol dehydrogenase family [Amycolatopsis sacchari]